MQHLTLVTNGFFAGSFFLGIPSLLGFLYFGSAALQLWSMKTPEPRTPQTADVLIRGLEWGGYLLSKAGSAIGIFGVWLSTLLAGLAAAMLLFSIALFLTARGLDSHRDWARIAAFCLMTLLLLSSLGTALATGRLVAWILLAWSLYSIGALWRAWT